jgi:nucleotide-binding universal stress UspA family protein
MPEQQQLTPRILLATDFSKESEYAFYHALTLTLNRRARLTLLHTGSESRDQVPWDKFPSVRKTLTQWGLLPEQTARNDVADRLQIGINKMALRDDDPASGMIDYLRLHPTDLLVIAADGRTGIRRMLNPSIAERVAAATRSHTLIVSRPGHGFVAPETGASSLRSVLCAMDFSVDTRSALTYLGQWLPAMGSGEIDIHMLQVCEPGTCQDLILPRVNRLHWHHLTSDKAFAEAVFAAARDTEADLVVTTIEKPPGLLKRRKGSDIDQILKTLQVPVLSMPIL